MKLDPNIHEVLKHPMRASRCPSRSAWRTARSRCSRLPGAALDGPGPAKGGVRFHQNVTLHEVKALAM